LKINHSIENQDGSLTFEANLSEEELSFVVELGLNILLAKGVMPFTTDNIANIQQPITTPQ
jgi:hypothetical protein